MRKVSTQDGVGVLLRGGSQREALAADDAAYARWAAETEAASELTRLQTERARLDLIEQRLRVDDRIRRRQRRSAGSDPDP